MILWLVSKTRSGSLAVFLRVLQCLKPGLSAKGTPVAHRLMHGWCVFQGAEFLGSLPAPLFKPQLPPTPYPPVTGPTRVRLPEPSATESSAPSVNSETRIVSRLIEDAPFTTLIPLHACLFLFILFDLQALVLVFCPNFLNLS